MCALMQISIKVVSSLGTRAHEHEVRGAILYISETLTTSAGISYSFHWGEVYLPPRRLDPWGRYRYAAACQFCFQIPVFSDHVTFQIWYLEHLALIMHAFAPLGTFTPISGHFGFTFTSRISERLRLSTRYADYSSVGQGTHAVVVTLSGCRGHPV